MKQALAMTLLFTANLFFAQIATAQESSQFRSNPLDSFQLSQAENLKECLSDCQSLIPDVPNYVVRACVLECQKKYKQNFGSRPMMCETYEPNCDQIDDQGDDQTPAEDDELNSEEEDIPSDEDGSDGL